MKRVLFWFAAIVCPILASVIAGVVVGGIAFMMLGRYFPDGSLLMEMAYRFGSNVIAYGIIPVLAYILAPSKKSIVVIIYATVVGILQIVNIVVGFGDWLGNFSALSAIVGLVFGAIYACNELELR